MQERQFQYRVTEGCTEEARRTVRGAAAEKSCGSRPGDLSSALRVTETLRDVLRLGMID
jgi:hypothetical protein